MIRSVRTAATTHGVEHVVEADTGGRAVRPRPARPPPPTSQPLPRVLTSPSQDHPATGRCRTAAGPPPQGQGASVRAADLAARNRSPSRGAPSTP